MNPAVNRKAVLDRRMRIACGLVLAGLVVELVTFFWAAPLSFVLFIVVGGLLVGVGVLVYLWTLIARVPASALEHEA